VNVQEFIYQNGGEKWSSDQTPEVWRPVLLMLLTAVCQMSTVQQQ